MKDLYKRLRIPDNASNAQIDFAIEHCENERLIEDAEYILLNMARRTVYDRNHKTLKIVGTLRNRLGMESTPFWGDDEYRDYIGEDVAPVKESVQSAAVTLPGWIENDRKRFLFVFSVLIVIYAFLFFLFF